MHGNFLMPKEGKEDDSLPLDSKAASEMRSRDLKVGWVLFHKLSFHIFTWNSVSCPAQQTAIIWEWHLVDTIPGCKTIHSRHAK